MKSPAYLAINPMGKVPALRHGDVVVTEAAAICAYLADAFSRGKACAAIGLEAARPLLPLAVFRRRPVESAAIAKSMGFVVPEDRKGMVGYGSMDDVLNTLEQAVSQGEYLVGDSFTAADLYLGSHLGWGMQFGTIEKRPTFEKYSAVCSIVPPRCGRARSTSANAKKT